MDPLKVLPEEVYENIFIHFKFKDVINASLVSKDWYQITGRSKECMSKIIAYHLSYREMPDIQHILNSKRQYQHLILFHDLKSIKRNTKVLRSLRAIVSKFGESLITLCTFIDVPRTSELPKLKELTIYCYTYYPHSYCIEKLGLASKAKNLETLTLSCPNLCKKTLKIVQQNIKDIKRLKVLTVGYYILDGLSSENLKLEEFNYCGYSNGEWIPAYYDFFNTQRPYLKLIDCNMSFQQILFFMEHFPKLETLIVRNSLIYDDEMFDLKNLDTLTYPVNESITTFGYHLYNFGEETNNLVAILSKMKNLQMLQLYDINLKLSEAIKDLKTLKIVEFRTVNLKSERIYRNIQRSSCKFIKKDSFLKKLSEKEIV